MSKRIEYKYGEMVGEAIFLYEVFNQIKRRMAMFRCNCGAEFIANIYKVSISETTSCGCYQKKRCSEMNATHGLSNKHPLYGIWKSMKARCYNKNVIAYPNYGGRGVTVCPDWKKNFLSFYNWSLNNGWQLRYQLDKDIKIPGSLVYSPETCTYVTPKENSNRRRSSKYIEYNGETKTISEWADNIGIPMKIFHQRITRWGIEKAFTHPYKSC